MQIIIQMLLFCFFSMAHAAGVIEAGQTKAQVCMPCHGAQGVSSVPIWPNLAAQHADYIAKQLHDYQQDKTRHLNNYLHKASHI